MQINRFDELVNICHQLLYTYGGAGNALKYINKRLSTTIQQKFKFGFFPSQEQLQILFTFLDKDELIKQNILYEKHINSGYQVLSSTLEQHNLMLPYRDVYGKIIALVGRSLLDDKERKNINIPKYKNTSFQKNKHLFGLFEAKHSIITHEYVYLVEGQFDCVQAHNHGIENVVALGSSNMSVEQLILLLRYTNKIYLLLDNDEAGELGRERILEKFGKYANFVNLKIPSGSKDLDEFLSEFGYNSKRKLYQILS